MPAAKSKGTARKPKKDEEAIVLIPELQLKYLTLKVESLSPIIPHKFSEKSRRQMEDAQQGKAKHKKPPKDPQAEYASCFYWVDEKKKIPGFPAIGFKQAAVSACRYVDKMTMASTKGAFFVVGDLITINNQKGKPHKQPEMRTDTVRVGGFNGTADIRYRPEFQDWSADLTIEYNAAAITPEQITNLFNIAGFSVGVGDWRPEKNGMHGRFRVAGTR